ALAASPPWIAAARWLGVYGLSFAVWLIAAWGAFGPKAAWSAFLLLPACSWLLPAAGAPDPKALLVQAEGPGEAEGLLPGLPVGPVDLAVLPEYAYTDAPAAVLRRPVGPAALARAASAPVVFGAVEGDHRSPDFHNVAAVVAADGTLLGTFPKQ